MNTVDRKEFLFQCAIGMGEIHGQVKDSHLGIRVEMERIECSIGLSDIVIETIPWLVSW